MRERETKCECCGEPIADGAEICVDGKDYCEHECMLTDNPQYCKSKASRDAVKVYKQRAEIKKRMRAMRKEAGEAGIPWN